MTTFWTSNDAYMRSSSIKSRLEIEASESRIRDVSTKDIRKVEFHISCSLPIEANLSNEMYCDERMSMQGILFLYQNVNENISYKFALQNVT